MMAALTSAPPSLGLKRCEPQRHRRPRTSRQPNQVPCRSESCLRPKLPSVAPLRRECVGCAHPANVQSSGTRDQMTFSAIAELDRPSRVACSDLLGEYFLILDTHTCRDQAHI